MSTIDYEKRQNTANFVDRTGKIQIKAQKLWFSKQKDTKISKILLKSAPFYDMIF